MFARCHHDVSQHTTMTQSRFTHVLYASHDRVSFKRESKFKHVFGILFPSLRTHFTSCLTQACPVRLLRTFLFVRSFAPNCGFFKIYDLLQDILFDLVEKAIAFSGSLGAFFFLLSLLPVTFVLNLVLSALLTVFHPAHPSLPFFLLNVSFCVFQD